MSSVRARPIIAVTLLVLALDACASSPRPTNEGATMESWRVLDGDEVILEGSSVPGPLLSVAAPPPGARPVTHPFLSASSRSARHESKLRKILDASTSAEDFLGRLRSEGFVVEPVEPVQAPTPG